MFARLIPLVAAAAAGAALAEPVSYQIDPTHTFVVFEADHLQTATVRGRFDRSEGTVLLDRQAKSGRVEIRVDAASVSTGVAALDGELKGRDFLNAADVPQVTFNGDSIAFDGDKVSSVAGTLTLLGRAQPVTLKAVSFGCYTNPLLKREVCGGDFETTLVRSLWGMTHGLDNGVPDRIRVLVQVEAIRQ